MKRLYKFTIAALFVFTALVMTACGKPYSPSPSILQIDGESVTAVNKEAVEGKIQKPENERALFYRFTESQVKKIQAMRKSKEGVSLRVTVYDDAENLSSEKTVRFGFLYETSFNETDDYKNAASYQPQVKADFSRTVNSMITLSMCVPKNGDAVQGFYVDGGFPFHITKPEIRTASIGWDASDVVPLYCFGVNGGTVDFSQTSANLSEGKNIFDTSVSKSSMLPKIEIKLAPTDNIGKIGSQVQVAFNYGQESFVIRRSPVQNKFTIQAAGVKDPFSTMEFTENAESIKAVMMSANPAEKYTVNDAGVTLEPLTTDLGMIYLWPKSSWRRSDYELFRWEQFPDVLFFDFSRLSIQNEFFTRLAYFVEKTGYKGTLVSDYFVENKHGYNAHDYKADDMARFFTTAYNEKFKLNTRELILRDILIHNGIILNNGDGTYSAGHGAVISFARESSEHLRHQFMAHESWHGIYFTLKEFRDFVDTVYESFDPKAMSFLKTYFSVYPSLQYDLKDEYLIRNEFMAYLMQQATKDAGAYFTTRAGWASVNAADPSSCSYVVRTKGRDFTDAANELADFAFKSWGFTAGRTTLISRE